MEHNVATEGKGMANKATKRTIPQWMCHCCHHPFVTPAMYDGKPYSSCCASRNIERKG